MTFHLMFVHIILVWFKLLSGNLLKKSCLLTIPLTSFFLFQLLMKKLGIILYVCMYVCMYICRLKTLCMNSSW